MSPGRDPILPTEEERRALRGLAGGTMTIKPATLAALRSVAIGGFITSVPKADPDGLYRVPIDAEVSARLDAFCTANGTNDIDEALLLLVGHYQSGGRTQ